MKKNILLAASLLLTTLITAQTTNLVWAKNLKYSTQNDFSVPEDLVIDNAGNYYVTGNFSAVLDMDPGPATRTISSVGVDDAFLAKYTNNGDLVWAKSFGTNYYEKGTGLCIVNNKLYLSGINGGAAIDIDPGPGTYTVPGRGAYLDGGFVAVFDTSGTLQSGFGMPCPVNSIKADNAGNIYITGQFTGVTDLDAGPGVFSKTSTIQSGTYTYDLFYGKYTSAGTMIWANTKGSSKEDNAYGIAVDAISGNVGIAGYNNNGIYVSLATPTGSVIQEGAMGLGEASDVIFDASGNVYFTGIYEGSNDFNWGTSNSTLPLNGTYDQTFVIKYNSSYIFSWAKQIPTIMSINNADGPAINLDHNGDVLVTSREAHAGSQSWLYFAKLSRINGSIVWRNNLISACTAGPNWNGGKAIAYNSSDQTVIVTGMIGGSNSGSGTTPCSFDADPGSGVYTLTAGIVATTNMDVFMGKYGNCAGAPAGLSAITGSTLQCESAATIYSVSAVSGADSYLWTLPNGWTGSSSSNTISVVTGSAGAATISVGATNGCGTSTLQTLNVQVNPFPSQPSSIEGLTNLCGSSSQTYSISAINGATSYSWALPGGWSGSSTTNTIQINTGTTGGLLSVFAINSCGNGPIKTLSITANPFPSISVNGNSSLCAGSNLTLTALGANTYSWSTSSNSNSISISPAVNTTYTVTGTDINGCENSASTTVTVNALPSVSINGPTSLCLGNTISLTVSGANTYTWSNTANTNNINISPSSNTSYTVTGTGANGCENTASTSVTVNALPSVSIGGTAVICSGNNTNLTASGASTYTWSTGSNSSSISISPANNTTYTVTGTDIHGCENNAVRTITVNALPLVSISVTSTLLCNGESSVLTASGANTYTWSTGGMGISETVFPTSNITYTLNGTDLNNCSNSAVVTLSVSLCTGITSTDSIDNRISIYPNPTNKYLTIQSLYIINSVEITDLLGHVVYKSGEVNDFNETLDLNINSGIYFVCIKTKDKIEKIKIIKE